MIIKRKNIKKKKKKIKTNFKPLRPQITTCLKVDG